ncbi:MAG: 4'-phosphopantetheinyl transferase superfamily protein [Oscillospiraceae bacterium]|nr:4'-phosphopantetheinyl transferase superfamily protein [Oscillospiraceae bacterium]
MEILVLRYSESLTFGELEGFLGCLTPARRKGVLKKKGESDRINALLSQLLVLSEITERTGIEQRRIAFRFGSHGKPYLKDSELQFSLSHTKGAVCAGFSDDSDKGEIGVDIERKDRRVSRDLFKRVLSDEELLQVKSGEDFVRFWVQKEAFLKRLGLGITRDLRGVNSAVLPDTKAIYLGDFFIGASGKGTLTASVREITLDELLGRFTKMV